MSIGGKRPAPGAPRKRPPLYTVEGHIWIEGREGTFLGLGRITLLERIDEFGSITRAAKSINMSYRRAWELVESMNRQAPSPLVTASAGGKGGGGAVLTGAGVRAIEAFRHLDAEFKAFREEQALRVERLGKG
jgi:molybdate transport system regulatory protein